MEKYDWLQRFAEGAEGAAPEGSGAESPETEECPQETAEQLPTPEEQQTEEVPAPDETLVRQHWQAVDRLYGQLLGEAEELKQLYPDFDLGGELRDPRFAKMLQSGVDMASAFQALHVGQILPAAMEYAAKTVQERMASSLTSGADRPPENGLRSGGAVMVGSQVSKLSRQDYANICRMVERGERVSFG